MRLLTKMGLVLVFVAAGSIPSLSAGTPLQNTTTGGVSLHKNLVLNLWEAGKPAFGIYVPASAYTV
jgi:hypothetical protein